MAWLELLLAGVLEVFWSTTINGVKDLQKSILRFTPLLV